jgi:hypothetical protein
MIKIAKAIMYKDARVLIAKLRYKEALIPKMEWTFPYVMLKENESPRVLVKGIFSEFGLQADPGRFFLKCVPSENFKIEEYYYESKYKKGFVTNSKIYSQFAWVLPTQILKYFTTTINKELMDYLRSLEQTGKGVVIE